MQRSNESQPAADRQRVQTFMFKNAPGTVANQTTGTAKKNISASQKTLPPIKFSQLQVSLKSVRVFYVTQLKFRTVVIQGFLITPCMNTSTITTKSKSLGVLN